MKIPVTSKASTAASLRASSLSEKGDQQHEREQSEYRP